ncbi:MAG: ACT domain-containing protein [Candidatus Brocadiia bacterium]
MRVARQLAVFLENKPGTLATMCDILARHDVNLLALTCSDTVDHAVVRIVADKPDEAAHALGNAGMLVVESEVLMVDVPNEPGALGRLADTCAEQGINIEYAYCTVAEDQAKATLVLRTHDPQRAAGLLSSEAL